jgi:hypothetical protein
VLERRENETRLAEKKNYEEPFKTKCYTHDLIRFTKYAWGERVIMKDKKRKNVGDGGLR